MSLYAGRAAWRNFETITTSSGTAADGWRQWWAIEARRTRTDWRSLCDAADNVLRELRAARLSGVSS
jgi:hypothetical protein